MNLSIWCKLTDRTLVGARAQRRQKRAQLPGQFHRRVTAEPNEAAFSPGGQAETVPQKRSPM
ncbi:MAG: hypothetical protein PVI91_00010 [Gammaproteobacteria bacterium]